MASGTISGSVTYNSSYMSSLISWSSVSNGAEANSSTITINFQWQTTNTSKKWDTVGQRTGNYIKVYVNGSLFYNDTYSARFNCDPWPSNPYTARTTTVTISHNDDGTPPLIEVEGYANGTASSGGKQYGPGGSTVSRTTIVPDTIQRYPVVSHQINSYQEKTINITWYSNANVNYLIYSTDGGTNWYDGGAVSGTSGNYTINYLSSNTNYQIMIGLRRADNSLWGYSSVTPVKTFDVPRITNITDCLIGGSTTFTISNPLNRQLTVCLRTVENDSDLVTPFHATGPTVTISTANSKEMMYSFIPNARSGTFRGILLFSIEEGVTNYSDYVGGTYTINENECKPDVSNCTGSYVADLTSLTNNNQTAINGMSTLTYTINTGATGTYSATITDYTVVWGDARDILTNISDTATLQRGNGANIAVTVKDSRGVTNTFNTPISEVVNYATPINLQINPTRLDGVGENVFLDVSGIIYYNKFGTNGVANKITNIKYSITNETAQDISFTDLTTLTYSEQSSTNHTQKFEILDYPIFKDGVSAGFDTTKTYGITVVVTDTAGTTVTITGTIKDGKFGMARWKDNNGNYHYGINGIPDANDTLWIHGNIKADNITPFNPLDAYPVGSIYMSVNSTSPATLFGGTWSQIQDVFLLSAGSTYSAGSTGGSAYLQQHSHGIPALSGGTSSGGDHYHKATSRTTTYASGTQTNWRCMSFVGTSSDYAQDVYTNDGTADGSHWHSITTNASNTDNTGSGNAENMPPYLAVYVWKRTA